MRLPLSFSDEDRHQAPTSTPHLPLSLQGVRASIAECDCHESSSAVSAIMEMKKIIRTPVGSRARAQRCFAAAQHDRARDPSLSLRVTVEGAIHQILWVSGVFRSCALSALWWARLYC